MSQLEGQLEIRITHAPKMALLLRAVRGATNHSIADINAAIKNQTPLAVGRLFFSEHDDTKRAAYKLFKELDQAEAEFEILLDGTVESRETLKNTIQQFGSS